MTTDTLAATAGWLPATVVYADRPAIALPGEATPAAGLVITPHTDTAVRRYTGLWSVIHTGTGYHVGPYAVPLVYAREAVRLLADTATDWTESGRVLADTARGLGRVVGDIRDRVLFAWDEGIPTWWGRDSWTHARPAWSVHFADGGDHREDTWTSLVDWLTDYHTLAETTAPLYGGITTITREPAATWRLTCAAPLCDTNILGDRSPAVLAENDEDGGVYEMRYPDRRATARDALALGWRRHDRAHWTCPVCATAHAAAPVDFYGW
ncbi:hypothetical protein [Kibdelosporangium phytohabitans]|uniref:Uncharacterized protein n=1 Tax=Kibdelosporangium phytohabitans TaxID=860235 RepID=A0A0N9HVH1_9PSEU|nr:hypothetical protein [Kibdelosporangium phytohabitans]ALG05785.1 hypothetical protein AOZ06_01565 [Kibdelosporangium phytohabitans]MBE1466209.1 hypothetical protein [Kibdelosporangium phytohabitans]